MKQTIRNNALIETFMNEIRATRPNLRNHMISPMVFTFMHEHLSEYDSKIWEEMDEKMHNISLEDNLPFPQSLRISINNTILNELTHRYLVDNDGNEVSIKKLYLYALFFFKEYGSLKGHAISDVKDNSNDKSKKNKAKHRFKSLEMLLDNEISDEKISELFNNILSEALQIAKRAKRIPGHQQREAFQNLIKTTTLLSEQFDHSTYVDSLISKMTGPNLFFDTLYEESLSSEQKIQSFLRTIQQTSYRLLSFYSEDGGFDDFLRTDLIKKIEKYKEKEDILETSEKREILMEIADSVLEVMAQAIMRNVYVDDYNANNLSKACVDYKNQNNLSEFEKLAVDQLLLNSLVDEAYHSIIESDRYTSFYFNPQTLEFNFFIVDELDTVPEGCLIAPHLKDIYPNADKSTADFEEDLREKLEIWAKQFI